MYLSCLVFVLTGNQDNESDYDSDDEASSSDSSDDGNVSCNKGMWMRDTGMRVSRKKNNKTALSQSELEAKTKTGAKPGMVPIKARENRQLPTGAKSGKKRQLHWTKENCFLLSRNIFSLIISGRHAISVERLRKWPEKYWSLVVLQVYGSPFAFSLSWWEPWEVESSWQFRNFFRLQTVVKNL